jgi:hypothetical protein
VESFLALEHPRDRRTPYIRYGMKSSVKTASLPILSLPRSRPPPPGIAILIYSSNMSLAAQGIVHPADPCAAAQQFQGFAPSHAGVRNALPVHQRLSLTQLLCSSDRVALEHHAEDASVPACNPSGDVATSDLISLRM